MARANWGGGGDYSGIFSNLFDAWEARMEAATNRNIRREEEEQAAHDAEAYDQWQRGLMTDDQWIKYLERRVELAKGDPKERQEWEQTLAEHTTAIRDAQTETAFSEGRISVHAAIGYYRGRLDAVERDSPEYRELISRYYQLIDTRDSDQIYDGAERIIDRIERGNGSYRELLNFYKERLKGTRKNSDLRRTIEREIDQIEDIIDQVGASSGRSGGARSGGGGGGGGVSATQANAINEALVMRARGGSVYDSSGKDPFPSITGIAGGDIELYEDALLADLNRIEAMATQRDDNPNAQWITDPLTGEAYPNTPEFWREVDNMYLRQEEQLFAVRWADGRPDEATSALEYRQNYISNHMQKHNSEDQRPAWDEQTRGAFAALAAASAIADPSERTTAYANIAAAIDRHADAILKDTAMIATGGLTEGVDDTRADRVASVQASKMLEVLPDAELQEDIMWTQEFFRLTADPSIDVATRQAMFEDLFERRPEGYWLTSSGIEGYINGSIDGEGAAIGVMETYAAREGLNTPGEDGLPLFSMVDTGGIVRAVPTSVLESMKNEAQMVLVIEKIGGQTREVWRPVIPADETDAFSVWVDSDGKTVDTRNYTLDMLITAQQNGTLERKMYAEGWNTVQTSDGTTWYQDPKTRLWYMGRIPVNVKTDASGALMLNEDGTVAYEVQPWASEGGVIAPFAGVNAKSAQRAVEFAVESGLLELGDFFTRDEFGNPAFNNPNIEGMYYDPSDVLVDEMSQTRSEQLSMRAFGVNKEREVFKKRQEVKRRSAADAWLKANFDQEQQMLWRKLNPETDMRDYATEQIAEFGSRLGITIGAPELAAHDRAGGPIPQRSVPTRPPQLRGGDQESAGFDVPRVPLPTNTSGKQIAPVLPKPPRPNIPEFTDKVDVKPKVVPKAPPPVKASDKRRKNLRET